MEPATEPARPRRLAHAAAQPDNWMGSTSLLALHAHVGHKPVQYCQCFVYAAVTTSVGRALGNARRSYVDSFACIVLGGGTNCE